MIVFEIKGSHTKGRVHRGALSLAERESELRELQISKAAAQLASTITDLRSFRIQNVRLPSYDWTSTTIIPVTITYEGLPLIWKLWSMYERLTEPLQQLPLQSQIAPVRFISVADVEELPDLAHIADLGSLMLRWGHDSVAKERPLSHFLKLSGTRHLNRFQQARVRDSITFLASRIGLDVARVFENGDGDEE